MEIDQFKLYRSETPCLSFKSIVGVAGGATRSALTQHQAKNNNLADVSAKDSSQVRARFFKLFSLTTALLIIPTVI